MADASLPTPPRPRPLRRWLLRFLLASGLVLALAAAFHRSLILTALNRFGPEAARRAGVVLSWRVDGSLWSDVVVNDFKAKGDGYSLQAGHVEVRYDLHPSLNREWFKIPRALVLHDVQAVIDLRSPAPSKARPQPSAPLDRQALMDLLHQIVLPDIELHHVTLTVLMPDEALTINDLSLDLPSGREGRLHIASVEHPLLASYPLKDVEAALQVSSTDLHVAALKLAKIEISELTASASHFDQGLLSFATTIHSGKAAVVIDASADVKNGPLLLDASVDVSGVDEQTAAAWLPAVPEWKARLNKFHVTAKGDVMQPRKLNASISLDLSEMGFQQWPSGAAKLEARLNEGRMEVSELSVSAAGNEVKVTTSADAPADWPGFARTPLQLNWKIDAPALQALAGLPVKLGGSLTGSGDVKLNEQGLQTFSAVLGARGISVNQNKVKTVDARITGDMKSVAFEASARADAGDGELNAHGSIGLQPGTQSDASWKINLPQPAVLVRSLGIAWPEEASAGAVALEGNAHFDLTKLKASQFDDAKGQGTLSVKDIAWKGAPCPQVTAAWSLADGKATLSALDVELTSTNRIHFEGTLALAGMQAFTGALSMHLPDLAGLQPWVNAVTPPPLENIQSHTASPVLLGAADGKELLPVNTPTQSPPKMLGGSLALDWNGSGSLKDGLKLQGRTTLKVDQCRLDRLPEPMSLDLQASHDLGSAKLDKLITSFGPWIAKLNGSVGKTGVDLPNLEVSNAGRKVLSGSFQVPLDLQEKPLPLDRKRPMHVRIDSEGSIALADLAAMTKAKLSPGLAATMSTHFEGNGTYPALRSCFEFKVNDLRVPQMPGKDSGKVALTLSLDSGALTADFQAHLSPLEPVMAHLATKLDLEAIIKDPARAMQTPFEASVKLHQPSLDFVKPLAPMLDDLRGSVQLDAQAGGTAAAPHISGLLVLDVPSVEPHDTDLPLVKNLKAKVIADDTLIKVESFQAVVAGGEVSASGSCDLKDTAQPAFDVSLKARDLLVMRNEMLSQRTDADLTCKGSPKAARFSGTIGLTRGRVFQEVNFLPLSKLMNDLPPLPDAQAGKPAAAESPSLLPPALAGWTFDVALKTKDSIRLLGNVLNGGVKVDVHLGGDGKMPLITGGASLEDARLNLPFSTLRVKTGEVTMVPDYPLAPNLELLAESTVDAYDIELRGHGSVLDPKLRFTSTPPLAEGEIATLLATGSTTSGLKKAGDDAAGRALLFVVREAYRRAFNSSSKPLAKGEKPSESRFIVQERTEDGALGGVTGIYEFSRKMKIVGSTDKQGGFRAMLHYLFHFD